MAIRFYHHPVPFRLERGGVIHGLTIAYHTFGRLSPKGDNAVWVCHALTADSDVSKWWPHTVEEGCFLDPQRWFVVCANIVGSCYGSTGPLSVDPVSGRKLYGDFPALTVGDWANAHALLADALGIERVAVLVGSSVGGFQALEWGCRQPWRFESMVLIATDAKASPWTIAIDETQRMAIKADKTFGERRDDAAEAGLAAARAIGLLTYRGPESYNLTQAESDAENGFVAAHRASTYQRYQGEKLCRRFNAYSYVAILDAFDTHDIGRGRGGVECALRSLEMPVCVVGITTDIIFTPAEMLTMASRLPRGEYHEIKSDFAHDGFLVEHDQLNRIVKNFYKTIGFEKD